MPVAGFRIVRAAALTAGATQDFTVSGMGTVKAYRAIMTRATSLTGTRSDEKVISWGVCVPGTFQGGVAGFSQHATAVSNTGRSFFDDAVIRLPTQNGGGFAAVATHSLTITDGVRIAWSVNPPAGYIIDMTLYYGADLQVTAGSATPPTLGSGNSLINTGFRPDYVQVVSANMALDETLPVDLLLCFTQFIREDNANDVFGMFPQHGDAQDPTAPTLYLSPDRLAAVFSGNIVPFTFGLTTELDPTTPIESNGFRILTGGIGAGAGPTIIYLALNFATKNYDLQLVNTPTATGSSSLTGLAWTPGFVECFQTLAANWNGTSVDSARAGSFGFSAFNMAGESFASCVSDRDNVATSDTSSRTIARAISLVQDDGTTLEYEAAFTSFQSGGYTLNWTTVQAAGARKYTAFILEGDVFTATGSATLTHATADGVGTTGGFTATGAATLSSVTGAGVASEVFSADSAATLTSVTAASVATAGFTATADAVLSSVTSAGVAELGFSADSNSAATLGSVTGAGVGSLDLSGDGAATLSSTITVGIGQLIFSATSADAVLSSVTAAGEEGLVAAGAAALASVTGAGAVQLVFTTTSADAALSSVTAAGQAEAGSVSSTTAALLSSVTGAGIAEEVFAATSADAVLASVTGAGVSEQIFSGAADAVLSSVTAEGAEGLAGAGDATLSSVNGNGLGELIFSASAEALVPSATGNGLGELVFDGLVAPAVLSSVTAAATGNMLEVATATAACLLSSVTASGVGNTDDFVATANGLLSSITGNGTATIPAIVAGASGVPRGALRSPGLESGAIAIPNVVSGLIAQGAAVSGAVGAGGARRGVVVSPGAEVGAI